MSEPGIIEALSIPDAARAAGIGRALMYKIIGEGSGPKTLRIGARRLVRRVELERWLAELESRGQG